MNSGFWLKPNVQTLLPYSVPVTFDGVKLNQNEGALDIPAAIKEEIYRRLSQRSWNRYPAPATALLEKIAAYAGVPVQSILAGSGSNELIQTIIAGCCDAGDALLTVTPTFPVYRRVADVMGIGTIEIPLQADFSFDLPRLQKAITTNPAIKLIILACPNNPTGTVLKLAEIQALASNTRALVVMDEAYFEFYRQSAQVLLENCKNIVILRTLSKAFRAAGLRLGYMLTAPALVTELDKVKLPFSLGLFQQVAGEVILEKSAWLQQDIATAILERERVFLAFSQLPGIQPVPSQANFILFRCVSMNAAALFAALQKKGVLLRSYGAGVLAGMLRVSMGTVAENNLFLEALKASLAEFPGGGVQ